MVALLGFMPLIIVHWSDRQPRSTRFPRGPRAVIHTALAAKTAVLVSLTDWVITIAL